MVGKVGFKLKLSETFPFIFKEDKEREVIKIVIERRQMSVSHDHRYKKSDQTEI